MKDTHVEGGVVRPSTVSCASASKAGRKRSIVGASRSSKSSISTAADMKPS
jgi:hypothetical protein